jgi:predicted alpha-1,2-mannosidase
VGELLKSPNDMKGFQAYKNIIECNAGYISVEMADGLICNATVSKRTAIAQFVFPENSKKGTVIIGSGINDSETLYNSHVTVTSPVSAEGFAEGGTFCGHYADTKYRVYFAAEFNRKSSKAGTWKENDVVENQLTVGGGASGAYFTFDTNEENVVEYRIAISYVSVENARENLLKDNNKGEFSELKKVAEAEWNKRLGIIEINSQNTDRIKQFYTHLYHVLIHPNVFNDINGEYIGSDYKVHTVETGRDYYTSFSGWDTYRTQSQLLAILYPKEVSDMMQSAVEFAQQAGGFGRWVLANIETGIMQGDAMSIIVANSYTFGAKDFNLEEAFKYMKYGATIPGLRSQKILVRQELADYMTKGYVESASLTLEYSSADFAIGQFALQALNNKSEAAYFINRAQNWKNLYNPATTWLNSRNPNTGDWLDPNHGWMEATKKNYFWMVPFNLKSLIDTIGKDLAIQRLDTMFVRLDADYNQDWFAGGNEPDFQLPWTYNWVGQPYKTTQVMNRLFNELYKSTNDGLPGNDDLGALGSFYVFGSIGLYPMIPGVAGFAINKPHFEKITIHLLEGDLHISGGDTKSYINSMKLNGKSYNSSWINWSDIKNGGKIEYELTSDIKPKWAVHAKLPSIE